MKIGFIGCGNMATAMITGIIRKNIVTGDDILVSARTKESLEKAEQKFGVQTTTKNRKVAETADVLVLAIKPDKMEQVIWEISEVLRKETVVVTLAPGKTLAWLDQTFDRPVKIIRTMPNTPALVGEGMTALCPNDRINELELQTVEEIFGSFGKTAVVPEKMIDVVTGVSGSSPAYVFLFIEALADAAVKEGMQRKQAYDFAAQAVLGSAKMVLETGLHPGVLKDMVCSPGGTTIEAVRVLEECGLRSAVMEAAIACVEKAREL